MKLAKMPNGCREWIGYFNHQGYGRTTFAGVAVMAHRLVWELAHGPIPEGLFVLHKCDNPPCCNVAHLFLGTQAENMADMAAKGRSNNGFASRTHCPAKHPYDATNTYVDRQGYRHCRACKRDANHRYTRPSRARSAVAA